MGDREDVLVADVDGANVSFVDSLQAQLVALRQQATNAEARANTAEQLRAAAETLAAQLQHALDSRIVIEQAKGILAERHGLSVDEAFRALRSRARATQRKLQDLAAAVVAGRERLDDMS